MEFFPTGYWSCESNPSFQKINLSIKILKWSWAERGFGHSFDGIRSMTANMRHGLANEKSNLQKKLIECMKFK